MRALLLALLATALIAAPVRTKAAKSKPVSARPSSASHRAPSSVSSSKVNYRGKGHSRLRSSRSRVTPHSVAPSYQLHPDPERYQQIQQSLAERGYFKGEANGQWNDDSVDALKRFQADQKLDNDGKINALTLTGLGLGPKHDGSTASTVPLSAAASTAPGSSPPDMPAPPADLPSAASSGEPRPSSPN